MTLRLSLLSSPHVVRGGDLPAIALASRDAVMLAWLALVGPTTRAQMAAMLWPDSSEDQARNSLRQRLFQLRRQIGTDLVVGATTMEISAQIPHDLEQGSGLLGDLSISECPSLEGWLQATRERRAREQRGVLLERLEQLESEGNWDASLSLAEAVVDLEPLSEHAHRRVMRLHYLRGDRAAALLAFDRLEKRLKDDVGTRPDAASMALLRTIEQAEPLDNVDLPSSRPMPASLLRPPLLIGRDADLERIRQQLADGRVVAVIGEAGMGKSRLLQALVNASRDAMFWSGRPGDAMTPYATLARGLRDVLRALPPDTVRALPAEVQADLARVLPEWAAQRNAAGAANDATPTDAHADALHPATSHHGGMPVHCVRHLLRLAHPRGATFVLDDLHFADEASTELLQQGLDDDERRLWRVVFAMRPTPRSQRTQQWVQQLIDGGLLAMVELRPLEPRDLERLVDSLELPGIEGRDLGAALHLRTGGNPLFALETLRLAWTERPSVDASHLPRPSNVAQLIEQQLVQLSPGALMLARVAALAGVDFSLALAEDVLDKHAVGLSDAWRELEAHQVMRGEGFAHDLVHETVRAGVPETIGRHLHGRIADWLQGHGGEPARIAAHHEAAGRGDLAVPGLRAAADRAHDALREPERIDFLLRAADLAQAQGDRGDAFACLQDAIEAHIGFSRDDSKLELLDRLDALAATPSEQASAAQLRAYYHGNLGQWALAAREGERALDLALRTSDDEVRAKANQRLGTAYAMTGQCEQAVEHLLAIRDWMQAHADPAALNEYHGNLAVAMDNAGRIDEARRMHELAIDAVDRSDDHAQRVTNLGNLAVNRLNAGDVAGAREHLAVARQLVATFALAGTRGAFIDLLQARCARALGRYDEALALYEKARGAHEPNVLFAAVVRLHEAQCWLDLAAHDRAAQCLQDMLQGDAPARYRVRALVFKARLARAQQQRGDAFIDEALRIAPLGGWHDLRMMVRTEAAPLLAPQAALDELAAVTNDARRMGYHGAALAAQLEACGVAAVHAPERGARLARQALLASANAEAESRPRIDRWLQPARALLAAGENDEAADVLRMGATWLASTADRHVNARWREGFVQRHEQNALLAALHGKLG